MRGVNSEQMIDEVFKAIDELIDLIHAFSKGQFPATDEEGRIRKFIDEHASGDLTESDKNAMRRITGDRRTVPHLVADVVVAIAVAAALCGNLFQGTNFLMRLCLVVCP